MNCRYEDQEIPWRPSLDVYLDLDIYLAMEEDRGKNVKEALTASAQ